MSLSKMPSLRPLSPSLVFFLSLSRSASTAAAHLPLPAQKQLPPPSGDGFFSYARNWSRDNKYDTSQAPQLGDTPYRFLVRRLGHAYEIYPLFFLMAFWFSIFCVSAYYSFGKVEIWLDRSKDEAPWDWTRIRNKYHQMPTLLFDRDGRTHRRLEIMETLQDEMIEAAKKRGTRK